MGVTTGDDLVPLWCCGVWEEKKKKNSSRAFVGPTRKTQGEEDVVPTTSR